MVWASRDLTVIPAQVGASIEPNAGGCPHRARHTVSRTTSAPERSCTLPLDLHPSLFRASTQARDAAVPSAAGPQDQLGGQSDAFDVLAVEDVHQHLEPEAADAVHGRAHRGQPDAAG